MALEPGGGRERPAQHRARPAPDDLGAMQREERLVDALIQAFLFVPSAKDC